MNSSIFDPPELGCVLDLTGLPGSSSKIYDRSPYGHEATIYGEATWVRLPSGLWCLYYDGSDDYVNCGNHASLDVVTALTIEVWFKAPTQVVTYPGLVSKGTIVAANTDAYYLRLRNTGFLDGGIYTTALKQIFGAVDLRDDIWHFGALTYDGSNIRLYVDGIEVNSLAVSGAINIVSTDLYIGSVQTGYYFTGRIALPCIYNRALTALELQNHFRIGKCLLGIV